MQAGLKSNSLPEKAYLVRPHALGGEDQVYKIDWFGIKDRGDTLTNYQIFPRRSRRRAGHQAAGFDQQPAGKLGCMAERPFARRSHRSYEH